MRCILVDTPEKYDEMEAKLGLCRLIGLDTETTMLDVWDDEFSIVGVSVAGDTQTGYYIPLGHKPPPGKEGAEVKNMPLTWTLDRLETFLAGRRTVGANHKFDIQVFMRYGRTMGTTVFDVLIAAAVWDSADVHATQDDIIGDRLGYKPISIKWLTRNVLPPGQSKKIKKRKRLGFEYLTPEEATPYAAADAVNCLRLHHWYAPRLRNDKALSRIFQLEMDLMPVLVAMESRGMCLDLDRLGEIDARVSRAVEEAEEKLRSISGNPDLNPRSAKEVGDIIYHQMGVPHPKGRTYKQDAKPPKGFMDKDTISDMSTAVLAAPRKNYGGWSKDDVAEFLSKYALCKKLQKVQSGYTQGLPRLVCSDGKLHTSFKQIVSSGRMSSAEPNLQNVTRADENETREFNIRSAFVPREGYVFVKADYSAQEMRIIAALSNDPTLKAIFTGDLRDEDGDTTDVHIYVGSLATGTPYMEIKRAIQKKKAGEELSERDLELIKIRQDAKPVNFGIAYGETEYGLANGLKCSVEKARDLLNTWKHKAFPVAARWLDDQVIHLRANLYTQTAIGRRRRMSKYGLGLSEKQFQNLARAWQNHPIQGCFRGDTIVWTDFGHIRIDDLFQLNDPEIYVWDCDEFRPFRVVQQPVQRIWRLVLYDGTELYCTEGHPIRTLNGNKFEWTHASEINKDSLVVCSRGTGRRGFIVQHGRVEPTNEWTVTYDLQVDSDYHAFVANGVVVHNSAGDMAKQAMVDTHRALAERGLDAGLVVMIHDEIVVEARRGIEEEVKDILVNCMETELLGVKFPVDAEIVPNLSK